MAQPIKYNTGSKTSGCCIRRNNFDIGIVQNREYGPTSSTNFWNGYNVPTPGGFVSFQNKISDGPSIYSIPSINDLVLYGNNLNIGPVSTAQQVISICSNTPDLVLVNTEYPEIPSIDNNIFTIDAGFTPSYGWLGGDWFDITGNQLVTQGSINGSTTFYSGNSSSNYTDSYFNFDANQRDAFVTIPDLGLLSNFTINVWVRPQNTANYGLNVNLLGQVYADAGYTPLNDCNFLLRGNNGYSFQGVVRVGNNDYVVNDTGSLGPNQWYNFTLVYRTGTLTLYKNGTKVTDISGVPSPNTNGNSITVAGTTNGLPTSGGSTDYFNGDIGLVNIYNTAMDSGAITSLYNAYSGRY